MKINISIRHETRILSQEDIESLLVSFGADEKIKALIYRIKTKIKTFYWHCSEWKIVISKNKIEYKFSINGIEKVDYNKINNNIDWLFWEYDGNEIKILKWKKMDINIGKYGLKINGKKIKTNKDIEKLFDLNSRNIKLSEGIDLYIFDNIGISVIKYTTGAKLINFSPLICYKVIININTNPNDNKLYPKENYKGKILFFDNELNINTNSLIEEILAKLKFDINQETLKFKGINYYFKNIFKGKIEIEIKENKEINLISIDYK